MSNSENNWQVRYADSVIQKDIPKLDHAIKKRIRKNIESKLLIEPYRFGKPLQHSLNHMRSLRVGDYRVLYNINNDDKLISIVAIGHRKRIYEQ